MNNSLATFILLMSAAVVLGQRPFFAGTQPIGYPETPDNTNSGLGDRFGEVDGTTPRLPIEAHGDRDFFDRVSKLPIDKQPFWFINWQAYEANRKNPQTYPQRPNTFIDPIPTTNIANSGAVNSAGIPNSNSASSNSNSASTSNSDSTVNRFGESDSNSAVKPVASNSDSSDNQQGDNSNSKKPVASDSSDSKKEDNFNAEKPVASNSDFSDNKKGDNSNSEKPVASNSIDNKKEDNSNSDSSDNKKGDNPNSEVKPAVSDSGAANSNSNSETGSSLGELTPLIPSPIEAQLPLSDGLNVNNDTSDKKLYRHSRRF